MTVALGVDAAGRFGWAGVVIDDEGFVAGHVAATLADVVREAEAGLGGRLDAIGVDIPIGLVDTPFRAADQAARAYVGVRRSSVFWAPHRSVIDAADQASANDALRPLGLPLMSAQAFGLVGRIREVASHAGDERVIEVFPEATFRCLAGADVRTTKKSWAGMHERLALLAGVDPPIRIPPDPGPLGAVPADDAFDAAAAAWSARRHALGAAVALGDPAEVDVVTGRRIAVWV